MLIDHNCRRVVGGTSPAWMMSLRNHERHASRPARDPAPQFRHLRERAEHAVVYYLELATRPDHQAAQAWRVQQARRDAVEACRPLATLAARGVDYGAVSIDVAGIVARLAPGEAKRLETQEKEED